MPIYWTDYRDAGVCTPSAEPYVDVDDYEGWQVIVNGRAYGGPYRTEGEADEVLMRVLVSGAWGLTERGE